MRWMKTRNQRKVSTTVIIDVHAHAQPPDFHDILTRSGKFEISGEREEGVLLRDTTSGVVTLSPRMPEIRERVAEMDAHDVDIQILSLSVPHVYFASGDEALALTRHCNDYLASMVQQYPDRFRALASVPLTAETIDDSVRELHRSVEELGMVGFSIGSNINGQTIDDSHWDPFYEEANRLGAAMFVHPLAPVHTGMLDAYALTPMVGYLMDTTVAVSRLIFSNFFGRFLGINVIVGHLGGTLPFITGRLDDGYLMYPECQEITRPPSEAIQDLYVDTVSSHEPAIRCAIDTLGMEHILFGSDYPNAPANMARSVDILEEMSLGRRDKRRILGNNAAPLFGIESDDGPSFPLIGSLMA